MADSKTQHVVEIVLTAPGASAAVQGMQRVRVAVGSAGRDAPAASAAVQQLESRITQVATTARAAGAALQDVPPRDASGRFASYRQGVEATVASLRGLGAELQDVGGRLSMSITAPAVAGAGFAIHEALEYEQALVGVGKTTDMTEEQLAALGTAMTRLSEDVTPLGREELLGVAEAAGQLGIRTEAIEDFTVVMAEMGVSTTLTAEEAATGMARISNIMQTPQEEVRRLGSTIVALGNAGASTEDEILAMGLRIAGAGQTAGLTEPQVLAFANALSSVGIEAEAGGSAISTVMLKIHSSVAMGGADLRRYAAVAGMSAAEFKRAFEEDAAGAVTTFIEGLGRLGDKQLYQVLGALELQEIRVRDALLRTAGAGDLVRQSITLGNQAWQENTALSREAERFNATNAASLQRLWNEIRNTAGELGTELLPTLRTVVTVIREDMLPVAKGAIEVFAELPGPVRTTVIAIAGVGVAAGPVIYAVGNLVTTVTAVRSASIMAAEGLGILRAAQVTTAASSAAAAGAVTGTTAAAGGLAAAAGPAGALVVGLGLVVYLLSSVETHAEGAAARLAAVTRQGEEAINRMRTAVLSMEGGTLQSVLEARTGALNALGRQEQRIFAELRSLRTTPSGDERRYFTPQQDRRKRELAEQLGYIDEAKGRMRSEIDIIRAQQGVLRNQELASSRWRHPASGGLPAGLFGEDDEDGKGKKHAAPQTNLRGLGGLPAQERVGAITRAVLEADEGVVKLRADLAVMEEALSRMGRGTTAWTAQNDQVFELRTQLTGAVAELAALRLGFNAVAGTRLGISIQADGSIGGAGRAVDASLLRYQGRLVPASTLAATPAPPIQRRLTQEERERYTPAVEAAAARQREAIREVADQADAARVAVVQSFGDMVTAAVSATGDLTSVVTTGLSSIVSIAQSTFARSDPLLGTAIGVAGGILSALFGRRERQREQDYVQRVRLEEYGDRALQQQAARKEGPDVVILQLTDPGTGDTVEEQEYWLTRRERLGNVERIPPTYRRRLR